MTLITYTSRLRLTFEKSVTHLIAICCFKSQSKPSMDMPKNMQCPIAPVEATEPSPNPFKKPEPAEKEEKQAVYLCGSKSIIYHLTTAQNVAKKTL